MKISNLQEEFWDFFDKDEVISVVKELDYENISRQQEEIIDCVSQYVFISWVFSSNMEKMGIHWQKMLKTSPQVSHRVNNL